MQYSKNTNPHYTASQTPTLPFPSLRCLHCSAQPTTTAQPIQPASHPLTTAPSLATPREHVSALHDGLWLVHDVVCCSV
ncbi:hypothetical protein E2C01_047506 [Portunus trituberculatus]|uniref:Uncharacterized protein n=1 Tax=Portunus trituberculatus TaxID=210409 RepID=A0A5B7G843_PORTR|nr:hypothetical protein [Portunus trituberculatus]